MFGAPKSTSFPEPHSSAARSKGGQEVAHLGLGPSVELSGRFQTLGEGVQQDEATRALRGARSDHRQCPARAPAADQGRLAHADRVHDRQDVVGLLLDRREVGDLVGQANATRLKHHGPGKARQPFPVVVNVRVRPRKVDVLEDLQGVHDIDRTLAQHLIREGPSVAVDVLRGHRVHARQRNLVCRVSRRFAQAGDARRRHTASERSEGRIGDGRLVEPDRKASTPAAAARPSAMAQTMSDCPRPASPATNTPLTLDM